MTAVLTGSARRAEAPSPIGVLDIELTRPVRDVPPAQACAINGLVRCLARVHGAPVAVVDVAVPAEGLSGRDLGAQVWRAGPGIVHPPAPAGGLLAATVIVATRDRTDLLATCLDSLLASTHRPERIVVVDNAPSDDRTERMIADRYAPSGLVRYVREDVAGLGMAHNAGLPHVDTPIVAFTDDDVTVDRAWLEQLVRAFGAAPAVGCVTGLIFPAELATAEQWWIEQGTGFGKGIERIVFDDGRRAIDPLFPFTAGTLGSGASMAFSTDLLRSMGGFDPALGAGTRALGGDDLAALYRVVASGHRLVYEPAAVVFHRHRPDRASLERQAYGYGAGLTAYLTGLLVARPSIAFEMARRIPAGLYRALSRDSPLAARRPPDYPRDLVRRERMGMLAGPGRYLRSRWERRHLRDAAVVGARA